MGRAPDAEEPGGLLKGFVAKAGNFFEFCPRLEGAVGVAEANDVFGDAAVEAGDVAEELFGSGVQLHADAVDAGLDAVVEGVLEEVLFHIVLVLADADGFGVDLHQLRQWVHQTAADGDGAPDGEVVIREFLAGSIAGAVDGGAAFVDHDDGDGGGKLELADEGFGLAAGGAVADGDGFDFVFFDQRQDGTGGFDHLALAASSGVDDVVMQQLALGIEDHGLAAGAEAGVDGEGALLAQRRGEHEFAEVFGKNAGGFEIGFFLGGEAEFSFHAGEEEALAAIGGGESDLIGGRAAAADEEALGGIESPVFRDGDAKHKKAFFFAPAHGEEAVGRDGFERLRPVEIIPELGGGFVRFLAHENLAGEGGFLFVELADRGADRGIIAHAFREDIARS